jgi:hypothetical protein
MTGYGERSVRKTYYDRSSGNGHGKKPQGMIKD